MDYRVTGKDWKTFKELRKVALERYCQWVLDECEQISRKEDLSAHERYLEVFRTVKQRDKVIAEIFDVLSRSKASIQLLLMRKHGIVNEEEVARFSEELQHDSKPLDPGS